MRYIKVKGALSLYAPKNALSDEKITEKIDSDSNGVGLTGAEDISVGHSSSHERETAKATPCGTTMPIIYTGSKIKFDRVRTAGMVPICPYFHNFGA